MRQILLTASLILASSICSAEILEPFSPYADLSINNHYNKKTKKHELYNLLKVSRAAKVKNLHLAAIIDVGNCEPSWLDDRYVKDGWGKKELHKLRQAKIKYTISFGGPDNKDLSFHCSQDQLVAAYEKVLRMYKPVGLDFDIEHPDVNTNKMIAALNQLQQKHPTLPLSFTLAVLPTGFLDDAKKIVKSAQESGLRYSVNLMTMNYGSHFRGDMGEFAKQAATSVHEFLKTLYPNANDAELWKMIEVTPMIGLNSVDDAIFRLEDVDTLKTFAKEKGLRRLSMWSIGRDHPCNDVGVSPVCSSKDLQTKDYEFTERFMK